VAWSSVTESADFNSGKMGDIKNRAGVGGNGEKNSVQADAKIDSVSALQHRYKVRKMSSSSSSATGIMNASASKSAAGAKKVAKKDAPAVAVAVAAAPVAAAPVAEAKKAVKKAAAPAAAAAPVVVASTPVEAAAVAAPAVPTTTLDEDIKAVTGNLNTLKETVSSMLSQVKKLEKRVHRELKDARKRKRRVKVEEGGEAKPRTPSIFERPTQVTEELCKFLGRPAGTLMSRSEVTKAVNNYVKEKNLKNKHDIKPDAALKKLLAISDADKLTYFNLQRYLNRHYVKAVPAATA